MSEESQPKSLLEMWDAREIDDNQSQEYEDQLDKDLARLAELWNKIDTQTEARNVDPDLVNEAMERAAADATGAVVAPPTLTVPISVTLRTPYDAKVDVKPLVRQITNNIYLSISNQWRSSIPKFPARQGMISSLDPDFSTTDIYTWAGYDGPRVLDEIFHFVIDNLFTDLEQNEKGKYEWNETKFLKQDETEKKSRFIISKDMKYAHLITTGSIPILRQRSEEMIRTPDFVDDRRKMSIIVQEAEKAGHIDSSMALHYRAVAAGDIEDENLRNYIQNNPVLVNDFVSWLDTVETRQYDYYDPTTDTVQPGFITQLQKDNKKFSANEVRSQMESEADDPQFDNVTLFPIPETLSESAIERERYQRYITSGWDPDDNLSDNIEKVLADLYNLDPKTSDPTVNSKNKNARTELHKAVILGMRDWAVKQNLDLNIPEAQEAIFGVVDHWLSELDPDAAIELLVEQEEMVEGWKFAELTLNTKKSRIADKIEEAGIRDNYGTLIMKKDLPELWLTAITQDYLEQVQSAKDRIKAPTIDEFLSKVKYGPDLVRIGGTGVRYGKEVVQDSILSMVPAVVNQNRLDKVTTKNIEDLAKDFLGSRGINWGQLPAEHRDYIIYNMIGPSYFEYRDLLSKVGPSTQLPITTEQYEAMAGYEPEPPQYERDPSGEMEHYTSNKAQLPLTNLLEFANDGIITLDERYQQRMKTLQGRQTLAKELINRFTPPMGTPATYEQFTEAGGLDWLEKFSSLAEALEDKEYNDWYQKNVQKGAEADRKGVEKAQINTQANLKSLVIDEFRKRNLLQPGVSNEFLDNFDKKTLPSVINNILLAGGLNPDEDPERQVADIVSKWTADAPAYDWREEDYQRQFRSAAPPAPPVPGFPGFRVERPTPFRITELQPQLEQLAYDRPEFAQYVQRQLTSPSFMASFRQARKPVLPSSIGGIMEQILEPGSFIGEQLRTERSPTTQISQKEAEPGDFSARMPQIPIDPTFRSRAISTVKAGLVRRPDVTLAGFYQTSLPGFEESFRRSPLFAQQETRLETERAQEEARLKALDAAEERERRQGLRRGAAGGYRGYTRFARREN